MKNDILLKNCK